MAAGHISIRPKNHKPDITDLPKKLVHVVVWPPIRDGAMPEKVLSRGVQGQRVHQTEVIRNLISGYTFGVLYHRDWRVPNHHRVGLFKPRQIAWSLNNFDEVLLDRVTSAEGNSGGRSLPAGFVSFEQ